VVFIGKMLDTLNRKTDEEWSSNREGEIQSGGNPEHGGNPSPGLSMANM